jgi:hypothetical protein
LVYPYSAYLPDNSGFREPSTSLTAMPPIWEHSTLIRILLIRMGWTQPHNRIVRVKQFADTARHREMQFQWDKKVYPKGVFKKASVDQILDHNPPDYFRANLLSMIGSARARDVKVVLATFAYSPEFTKVALFATPEGQRDLAECNQVVMSLANEPGTHIFDFASVFPSDSSMFVDGQHVNQRGALLKAKLFADFLLDKGLVPEEGDPAL